MGDNDVTSADPVPGFVSPITVDANTGKIALVTGGGTGIGRAIAREMARTGAKVVIVGRRLEPLTETCALIAANGGEALAISADLREPENVDRVVTDAIAHFGRVDVLVNNAGGHFLAPATEISAKGWHAVFRISLHAMFELTREVANRSMIPSRGGVVVFIGFSPRRGIVSAAHASAARAGAENLVGSLACEWSQHRIRTVYVAAGPISSGHVLRDTEIAERAAHTSLIGRVGSPEEVAAVVAFLTSAGAGYITGSTVVVDGGRDAWGYGLLPPEVAD